MPSYANGKTKLLLDPFPVVTVKRCLPSFDGLTAGYIFTLWADVQVSYDDKTGTSIKWLVDRPVFDTWSDGQVSNYELPDGFGKTVFKYKYGFDIQTPRGYSSLITHPLAYPNLPFRVIPGIVDTDILKTDINTPLVFKQGFEGILEKGTPMFQLIPVQRQNWVAETVVQKPKEHDLNLQKLRTNIVSSYGRHMRVPKSYK